MDEQRERFNSAAVDAALVTLRNHRPYESLSQTAQRNFYTSKRSTAPEILLTEYDDNVTQSGEFSLTSSYNQTSEEELDLISIARQFTDSISSCGSPVPEEMQEDEDGDVIAPELVRPPQNSARLLRRRGSAPVIMRSDVEQLLKNEVKHISRDDSFVKRSPSTTPQPSPLNSPRPERKLNVPDYCRATIRRGSLPVEMMTSRNNKDHLNVHTPAVPGQLHNVFQRLCRANSHDEKISENPLPSTSQVVGTFTQKDFVPEEVKRRMSIEDNQRSSMSDEISKAVSKVGAGNSSSKKETVPQAPKTHWIEKKPKVKRRDLNAWAPNSM